MKLRIIPVCMALILILACGAVWSAEPKMVGGWTAVGVTKKEVAEAAAFAVRSEQRALQASKEASPAKLELVKILEAREQVVAGMNYQLTLKVRLNGVERKAEATVWWQAWRKPDPYQLTTWKWQVR